MPMLAIIPAAAVADPDLTDTQLRVLCAVGTFTNRLGGNVWASVETLAKASRLSTRTVQRALPVLEARGYLTKLERPGRTSLVEIVLGGGVTQESPHPRLSSVTPPPTELCHPNDKKNDKKNDRADLIKLAQDVCNALWAIYPKRETPHLYPPAMKAIMQCLEKGADPNRLVDAAELYALQVLKDGTEPRYVKSIPRFFSDGAWQHYVDTPRVHGRTREEWARSGQDVAEFDRLAVGA